MNIGIDLDATITAYPAFFSSFSKAMHAQGHTIYIITDRPDDAEPEIKQILVQCGITYDHIEITDDKASFIIDHHVEVLFDDMDRYFVDLPESVAVFKVRQHYNFDFDDHKWLGT